MALTAEEVLETLKECYDVKMTLTARGCPMHAKITGDVVRRLSALDGVERADVELVWDPPWTPDMMTDAGKRLMGRG